MKAEDLPTVVYLSRGDSAVYVVSGETQVSVVLLHLDAETVAVCLLVVESLWIPQKASGCLRTCRKSIPVWFLCISCKVEVFHVFIRVKGTGLNAKNHIAVHGYTSYTPRPANNFHVNTYTTAGAAYCHCSAYYFSPPCQKHPAVRLNVISFPGTLFYL